MDEIQKIKHQFLNRFKDEELDDKLGYFQDNFQSWINSLPSEIVPLVLRMVCNFDYYRIKDTDEKLILFHNRLNDEYKITDKEVLHTYIKKGKGKICSSLDYFAKYRVLNHINKGYCSDDIEEIPNETWRNIKYIVIADDCCGTGGSLEKFLLNTCKDFSGKTLFYLVVHMLDIANEQIKKLEQRNNMRIVVLYGNLKKKAFEIIDIDDLEKTRKMFVEECKNIGVNPQYSLGKDESEGLVAFYNNTPNNTIGVFWQDTGNNKAIFPRDYGALPVWEMTPKEMKKRKKERKINNYMAAKRYV